MAIVRHRWRLDNQLTYLPAKPARQQEEPHQWKLLWENSHQWKLLPCWAGGRSPCRRKRSQTQQPLLSHRSSGLVESSWRAAQPNQAVRVKGELTQLLISCMSQTQSQGATESECCLLSIVVEPSTEQSREESCWGVGGDKHQEVL